ncbi:MAG TPA: GNAT family N-acetyltransferase [Chitinophagaceae bacterium]|nr:GNAT family N-acetyltransferase [Chitinophagaceae bacterium]
MTAPPGITIRATNEIEAWIECAVMMAATSPWLTMGLDYAYCLKAFEGPCKEVYIAMLGNTLAGFVILQTCGSFKGYIQTLCVNESLRGRGIGKLLLQFSEERILAISPNIFICVSTFNKAALTLYTRQGFTLVGLLPNFVKGGFNELLLRKTVGPVAGYVPLHKQ